MPHTTKQRIFSAGVQGARAQPCDVRMPVVDPADESDPDWTAAAVCDLMGQSGSKGGGRLTRQRCRDTKTIAVSEAVSDML